MPPHSYVALLMFLIQATTLLLAGYILRRRGRGILGTPSIDPPVFIIGKVTAFISWLFFVFKAIFPNIGFFQIPGWLSWIAVGIMILATLILLLSFFSLGHSLIVGLPLDETELKTNGIYSISRNPMYLSIYCILFASCLYYPDLINVSCAITSGVIHHAIVVGEEEFLAGRFYSQWENYRKKVRRYL